LFFGGYSRKAENSSLTELNTMTNQVIDVEVCIDAPVGTVWSALTNPDTTEKYWGGTRIESDWKKGGVIYYRRNGEIMDKHELLEIIPNRLIEHTFKPLFGEYQSETPSLVSIILQGEGPATRVIILHRNFEPSSKVYAACRNGWPEMLKALKALLEGGHYEH
jgi:uncharacterized protein YndB with AHSA1/START domain